MAMSDRSSAARPTVRCKRETDGDLLLEVSGRLESRGIHEVWGQAARALRKNRAQRVTLDAAAVTYCDSTGATMLRDLDEQQRALGGQFELRGFPDEYVPVLKLLGASPSELEECPRSPCWPEVVGRAATRIARDILMLIGAIGEICAALAHAVVHPRSVRWRVALSTAERAGVDSFPVVFLVSGLLGMIMAFQAAPILHDYGGDLLLANLIGISFLRELGPLMTAIVLTARSGSAFAAELGTMKINEEVDALRTMGADPVRFLVTPRVIAAIFMTPLLTVFANLAGLIGGFLVWSFSFELSLPAYVGQLEAQLTPGDLYTGLAKSVVFGTLVAGIGCIRGMQTKGSSTAVGIATTNAVVSGIVLIAMSDALFAIVFHYLEL